MPISKIVSPISNTRLTQLYNTSNANKAMPSGKLDDLNIIQNNPNSKWIKEQIHDLIAKLKITKEHFTLINGKNTASVVEYSPKAKTPQRITLFSKKEIIKTKLNPDGSYINKCYDKDGTLLHIRTMDKQGRIVNQTTYNNDGSKVITDYDTLTADRFPIKESTLSAENKLQKQIHYFTNSKQVKVEINYDKNGQSANSTSYTQKGIIHIKSNYSKNLVPTNSTIYHPSGKISSKITYDEQGKLLSAIDYDENGKEIGKVLRKPHKNDKATYYETKDSVPTLHPHPLAVETKYKMDPNYIYCRYKYLNDGRILCIKYTPNGTRIEHESLTKAENKIDSIKCSAADGTIVDLPKCYDYNALKSFHNGFYPEDTRLFSIYRPY